jgi:nucleoredoxin
MRCRVLAFLISLLVSIFAMDAAQLPFTAKDVCLMLRASYSGDTVMRDLAKRHFADKIDAAKETTLVQAGATPALVSALKSGTYLASPEEALRAKAELEAQAKRRAAQAEEARRFDTLYQDQLARKRAATKEDPHSVNTTEDYLKGCLVRLGNSGFVRADDDAMGKKKLIAYYFSAHWCGPCRKFTPQLVEYYNRVAPQHPEFEIVLYSFDKSAADMEGYMRESHMPWPAIDFEKREEKAELKKTYGGGIPSLMLFDSTGKLISSSFDGQKNLGPQKVLADLDAIFSGGNVAQTR